MESRGGRGERRGRRKHGRGGYFNCLNYFSSLIKFLRDKVRGVGKEAAGCLPASLPFFIATVWQNSSTWRGEEKRERPDRLLHVFVSRLFTRTLLLEGAPARKTRKEVQRKRLKYSQI